MDWRGLLQRPGDRVIYFLANIAARGLLGAGVSLLFVLYVASPEMSSWGYLTIAAVGFVLGAATVRTGPGII